METTAQNTIPAVTLACIAFTSVTGQTLLTRSASTTRERIAAEVKALESNQGIKVYALRSFCEKDGSEQYYEICTPAWLAMEPGANGARVEYWRRNWAPEERRTAPQEYEAGQHIDQSKFMRHGVILVPEEGALRTAGDYLSSPFERWNPGQQSWAPYTGDVYVVSSPSEPKPRAYVLECFGFKQVDFH